MENTPNDKADNSPEVQNPSRRRLLKFLAAGGAVTAVSLLPGKWSSPSVKTGVLPAHAQVTPTPTPIPDEYEVRCSPEWDFGESNLGVILIFSATAWNITDNVTVAGVDLVGTLNIDGLSIPPQTQTTDAQGVATFAIEVIGDVSISGASATVEFSNQALYGSDFCTTTLPQ